MLVFQSPNDVGLDIDEVKTATLVMSQVELVAAAQRFNLELYAGSFTKFSDLIRAVIDDPSRKYAPVEVVAYSRAFAEAGAERMRIEGIVDFHEWTWSRLCPFFPFC